MPYPTLIALRAALIIMTAGLLLGSQSVYGAQMTARHTYQSFDDQTLSYLDIGEGPTVLLLHGFMSNAEQNFVGPGIAQKIADAGYRVIAPDLRGHGQSQVIDDPRSWPSDAPARDQIALFKHLKIEPYAVVGYSYGSITALRLHLLSRMGEKLVLGGVGDSVAEEWNTARNDHFHAALMMAKGGAENDAAKRVAFQMRATGGTLEGYFGALSNRTYTPADLLQTFTVPVLVLTGHDDQDNGSGETLARILPNASHTFLTGDHITAVGDPALPQSIIDFLGAE